MLLKTTLSVNGINNILKEVRQYKRDLNKKIGDMLDALQEKGVEICRAEAISLSIFDTGELVGGINGYTDLVANKAFIVVDCDYAVFIEFGTGIPGKNAGYIGEAISEVAYQYMGGTHWVTLADGRQGWFYPGDDGKAHFTQGQASRPFMYNTAQKIRDIVRSL